MIDMLCAGPVDDLEKLIADCQFPPNAFFLVEMLPQYAIINSKERLDLLRFAHFDTAIPFASYTSGRIFHKDFELRWEKNNGKTQVVYLGTERSLPTLKVVHDLELKRSEQLKYYYLFGERLSPERLAQIGKPAEEGDFAEVRIPRLLRYPAPRGARRVRLAVREYVQEITNKVELFRFQDLEGGE